MGKEIKKVLIVDDSESVRAMMQNELCRVGYKVFNAINGNDAMNVIKQNGPFNIIISDLNMPECDGLSFLKEVRNYEHTRFTPFVIVTTETQLDKKNEAKLNGATGWIIKPFVMENLIKVISKLIG